MSAGANSERIRLLSPTVVERIAAGEVIERPASVVKELLENAFDAGAGLVTVEIEAGGASLIRVTDDGSGVSFLDAPALFQRHATSKLTSDEELDRLATFGFRGEALASIAAVAEVEMLSRRGAEETGFRLRVTGGDRLGLDRVARTPGTTITVRRLFFNTPARERYMHASREETLEVARVVTRYASARPEIAFRYLRDGDEALNIGADRDHQARLRSLHGADVADTFVALDWSENGVRVRGAVSRPGTTRGNAAEIHVFVNGRLVSDRGVSGALLAGYHGLLSPRRYPRAILLIELAADTVDVNVHPAKREVRFARRDHVQNAVRHAASRALTRHLDPRPRVYPGASTEEASAAREPFVNAYAIRPPAERESEGGSPAAGPHGGFVASATLEGNVAPGFPLQIDRTFILFADSDGLRLYDQHTAHERILFEDALRRMESRRGEAQELLIPTVLTLTPEEEATLSLLQPSLTALGYDIAPFGERAIAVSSHPSSLRRWDGGEGLRRMLAAGATENATGARAVASSYACRHAVMAGDTLSRAEMLALVLALRRAAEPELCPHGRPTTLTITTAELRRRFRRE